MNLHFPVELHFWTPGRLKPCSKPVFVIKRHWVSPSDYPSGTDILNSICAVSPKHVGCVQCALWAERVMRCQSLSVDKQACVLVSNLLYIMGVLSERQRG
jgi:hypothetical protein